MHERPVPRWHPRWRCGNVRSATQNKGVSEQVKMGFQMLRGWQAGGLHAGTILQQCLAAQ